MINAGMEQTQHIFMAQPSKKLVASLKLQDLATQQDLLRRLAPILTNWPKAGHDCFVTVGIGWRRGL